MSDKVIIVDIDNTIFAFDKAFSAIQKEKHGECYREKVSDVAWDTWQEHLSREQFYEICDEIHLNQHKYKAFPEAEFFLKALRYYKFYVIIASHRCSASREATELFLKYNNLIYDELHISDDKTVLFNRAKFIVDDAPHTLASAKEKGLICTGIRYTWNEHLDIPLFNSLGKILYYIVEGRI